MEANETPTEGQVWEAAEEQAMTDFDTEDSPVEEEAQEPAEAEPVEAAPAEEPEPVEPAEPAEEAAPAEEETPVVEEAPPEFNPAQWDGKMDSLPDNLKETVAPIYKTMERGMHMKFQELAQLRKQYEDKLESLQSEPAPSPKAEGPPPVPDADLPQEQQTAMWNARDEYFAKKAVEDQLKNQPADSRVDDLVMQEAYNKRASMVQQQDGFTPEVGQAMSQLAETHPYYQQLTESDEGALVLFHTAKIALENAELKNAKEAKQQAAAQKAEAVIKKKAGAAKGAVDRPSGTRAATPEQNFAGSWDAAEKAALEAHDAGRTS